MSQLADRPRLRSGALVAIFLLALFPRMLAVAAFPEPPTTANDAGWYDAFGHGIADGAGYVLPDGSPTSRWPPGYPVFVGAVYKLTADSRGALRVTQAVIGALTAVLVAELGRRLMSARVGIAAAFVVALTPSHVLYSALIMSEVLFTALIVGAMLLALRRSIGTCAAAGVLLGCATLVRSQAVLLTLAIVLTWIAYGAFGPAHRASTLRSAAAMFAALVLTLVPWTVRNATQLDTFQPVSTNLGINLWIGNHADATGRVEDAPVEEFDAKIGDLTNPEAEVKFDRLARDAAIDEIADHPATFVRRAPRKVYETWRNDSSFTDWYEPRGTKYLTDTGRGQIDFASNAAYMALLALAAAGIAMLARQDWRALVLPVASVVLWSAVSVVFFGDVRFHVPMLPLLALPAGHALADVAALASRRWAMLE